MEAEKPLHDWYWNTIQVLKIPKIVCPGATSDGTGLGIYKANTITLRILEFLSVQHFNLRLQLHR